MSQQDKSALYQALKAQGMPFDKHYREYSETELRQAWDALRVGIPELPVNPIPASTPSTNSGVPGVQPLSHAGVPVRAKDPNEMAGQRLNTHDQDGPLRIDENGRAWFQEEVQKPAFPKPRGRRVLTYLETGTKQMTAQNGEFLETFEVAGDQAPRTAEVKVTLPSFQVGCYQDPGSPFKVHVYNDNRGFDLFQVQEYYGGADLVPAECKRKYVENVLCFDIQSVIRAITTEARALELQGRM